MKRTFLAFALVASTFGAFAQTTIPAAKTETVATATAKPKHHKKAVKKAAVKAEPKHVEAKKAGK